MANAGSGTGQGGKSMQDRELAAKVRTLALEEVYKVLKKGKGELYNAVLIKLSGTILPRLNEHSGPDGKELPVPIFQLSETAKVGESVISFTQ